jgi:type I restriction enzyme S subunit
MAGRFQSYPSYKDSGVEWLGRIPAHWETWKLAHAFNEIGSGTTPNTAKESYFDGDIPWVTTSELRERVITDTETKLTNQAVLDHSALTIYAPGTLLFAMYGATIGRLGVLGIAACVNQACCALARSKVVQTRYAYFALWATRQQLISLASGGGQPNVNQEKLRAFKIPVPTIGEQEAIAEFLDRETRRIDALVKKKERLLELLQEQRTALISHVVTQGLNPNAPKKDSGIPWLGHIPAHWEVKRLKFIAEVRSGAAKGRDFGERDTMEVPYLRVANVQDGYLDLADVATIVIAKSELKRFLLRKGDVLMNEGGDYDKLGRESVWQGQVEQCVHQNHVFAVRPQQVEASDWINTTTFTSYAKFYFMLRSKQSTNLASISGTNVQEFPVVMPPALERHAILKHLNRATANLDALMAKVRTAIERLQEYRTALISAAVTGSIDVRQKTT